MYKKGDFHLHTSASDGKNSPTELLRMAKKENLDILSITDHDTISGIDEGKKEGCKLGITIIPGIELSTLYNNESIHVLGYFKNIENIGIEFKNYLKEMNDYRIYRARKMVDKLYGIFNIKLDYEKILKDAKGIIARPHIAKAIIEAGYNYTWDSIFKNLIGENSPAYVKNKKLSTDEGIKLLNQNHALVSLAHPVLIKNTNVEELLILPFDGIEAVYSTNTYEDTEKFKALAKKYNKIITAGSDYHGITKEDGKHASKVGAAFLDEKNIEIFLDLLEKKS